MAIQGTTQAAIETTGPTVVASVMMVVQGLAQQQEEDLEQGADLGTDESPWLALVQQ